MRMYKYVDEKLSTFRGEIYIGVDTSENRKINIFERGA